MNSVIIKKTYPEPPFCEKEILRYSGCMEENEDISALLRECINEIKPRLTYKVCYRELTVKTDGSLCDFDLFSLNSRNLAQNLTDCRRVILFAVTLGIEIDRLTGKYGKLSPAKALMLQAIGAERTEALCNVLCEDIAREYNTQIKPRFSPGYGDLPISVQRDIFAVLDLQRTLGITLNGSLLMSPTKSVTAFAGLIENK